MRCCDDQTHQHLGGSRLTTGILGTEGISALSWITGNSRGGLRRRKWPTCTRVWWPMIRRSCLLTIAGPGRLPPVLRSLLTALNRRSMSFSRKMSISHQRSLPYHLSWTYPVPKHICTPNTLSASILSSLYVFCLTLLLLPGQTWRWMRLSACSKGELPTINSKRKMQAVLLNAILTVATKTSHPRQRGCSTLMPWEAIPNTTPASESNRLWGMCICAYTCLECNF